MLSSASVPSYTRSQRLMYSLALLCMAAFSLPLLWPPASGPILPMDPDVPFWERLYPGVPARWITGRLLSLLLALALLWRLPPPPLPENAGPAGSDAALGGWVWTLVGLAALQPIVGIWAASLPVWAQLAFLGWSGLVPLLLWCTTRSPGLGARDHRHVLAPVSLLALAWLIVTVPETWQSARALTLLDTWIGLKDLLRTQEPGFNILTTRFHVGGGSIHLLLQGAVIVPLLGGELSYAVIQVAQYGWVVLGVLVFAVLAARVTSVPAAIVASAALLFSPLNEMMLMMPIVMSFGHFLTGSLLLLLLKVHVDRSPAAIAALGALGGFALTFPASALTAVVLLSTALWSALRTPRVPLPLLLLGTLLACGIVVTALPDLTQIRVLMHSHTEGRAQWTVHEAAGFGQISTNARWVVETSVGRALDTPVSALLAPFATPRNALRLIGDSLFDPLGMALTAVGLLVCARAARRDWFPRVLLAVLAVTMLPGFTTSQDRISLLRLALTPLPVALLAAFGFEALRPRRAGTLAVALLATLGCAAGGWTLSHVVNPRILSASWVTLAVQTLDIWDDGVRMVLLDHRAPGGFPYWYLQEFTSVPPWTRLHTRRLEDGTTPWLDEDGATGATTVLVWNPSLEEDYGVLQDVCRHTPGAELFEISDAAGRSRIFAAVQQPGAWSPAVPQRQWSRHDCGARFETEATRAAAALDGAARLKREGREQDALALLRATARQTFTAQALYEQTAIALLESGPDEMAAREAVHWAKRASLLAEDQDPQRMATLALAHAAAGDLGTARTRAADARALARRRGSRALSQEIAQRLQPIGHAR